ncbi:M56 family metallopeptidase [Micromonospora sp. NPDC047465]|uniref:M56 family metallopeptidase n=1 Tax=Micromonospora sp. NPDC047465 TaxID=3154813 RepID=UPI0033EAAF16
MISLLLLVWAVAVAVAAPRAIAARSWSRAAPRVAVGLWLGALASATGAVLSAGLLVAVPPAALAAGLDGVVEACARALARLGAPNETLAALALAATAVLAARLAISAVATLHAARRWRRHHLAALPPVARPGPAGGCTVVEHATPMVYCLPGRPGHVVVTRGALDVLTPRQLEAVLRHERAHLRGRHHLLVAVAAAFHRALPGLPLARTAEDEIRRLVEHLADDRAGAQHGRHTVAAAIVRLADTTPGHALGAGGTAVDRVRRLLTPAPPRSTARGLLGASAVALLLMFPLVTAATAAGIAVHETTCSHSQTSARG